MKSSTGKTEFHRRLRETRLEKGLNQAELAQKTGLQPSAISHFESGRRAPSFDNLRVLADVLGVSTDYLLGRVAKPGIGGATAQRLFKSAQEVNSRDLEILAEFAETLVRHANREAK